MVADMTGVLRRWRNCCVLLLCVIPAVSFAQALPDPTRPADAFTHVDQQATKDSGLQSVIISPTRRAAIINGQTVEQGGMLGDARLIEVNEGYVVLRNAEGKQVLSMFEGVQIKKRVSPPPVAHVPKHTMNKKASLKKKKSVGKHARQVKPPRSNEGDEK